MFNTFAIPTKSGVDVTRPVVEPPKPRRKRKQVSRACDLCRISRTKCDETFPCTNCSAKGVKCTKEGAIASKTLSSAILEIDKLQAKVKKLQSGGIALSCSPVSTNSDTPQSTDYSGSVKDDDRGPYYWKGIEVDIQSSGTVQYFGPSSTFAFLGRISSFLNSVLDQRVEVLQLSPSLELCSTIYSDPQTAMERAQEEFFLNLFWQTYHSLIPILCETKFRDDFDSLWAPNRRQQSPLVDIVLALCIQYGRNFMPESQKVEEGASEFYFDRCRQSLAEKWECPSMAMVQAYIFMVVYLQNSSRFTSAYAVLSQGVRAAHSIGLHMTRKRADRALEELDKRIWWSLFVLDIKLSIELGLPRCIDVSEVCCAAPRADKGLVHNTITNFSASFGDVSWLSFHVQEVDLLQAVQAARTRFFTNELSVADIYKNSKELERCAELLEERMKPIHKWAEEVPEGLKTPRKSGLPYSSHTSPVIIHSTLPLWLQLQRINLELEYHQSCVFLYRQFIRFTPPSMTATPLSDSHATSALNHSIAITCIIYEVLKNNIALSGWYGAFHFQWAAALTTMTYALAYPVCPSTPAARKWIAVAIEVFDILGKDMPIALSASAVLEGLNSNAKCMMGHFQRTIGGSVNISRVQTPQISNTPRTDDMEILWPEGDQYNIDMWRVSWMVWSQFPRFSKMRI